MFDANATYARTIQNLEVASSKVGGLTSREIVSAAELTVGIMAKRHAQGTTDFDAGRFDNGVADSVLADLSSLFGADSRMVKDLGSRISTWADDAYVNGWSDSDRASLAQKA